MVLISYILSGDKVKVSRLRSLESVPPSVEYSVYPLYRHAFIDQTVDEFSEFTGNAVRVPDKTVRKLV